MPGEHGQLRVRHPDEARCPSPGHRRLPDRRPGPEGVPPRDGRSAVPPRRLPRAPRRRRHRHASRPRLGGVLLLAQGVAATHGVRCGAATTERSVVLRCAFAVAVVVLAGGHRRRVRRSPRRWCSPVSRRCWLAFARPLAGGWAGLAGLRPLLAFIEDSRFVGSGTLGRLGLTGDAAPARRRRHRAHRARPCSATSAAASRPRVSCWSASRSAPSAPSPPGPAPSRTAAATPSALATIFLVVELVASPLAGRRSGASRARSSRHVAEWLAGLRSRALAAVVPIVALPFADGTEHRRRRRHAGARRRLAGRRPSPRGTRAVARRCSPPPPASASAVASATANDGLLAVTLVAHRRRSPCSAATGPARPSRCSPPPGRRSVAFEDDRRPSSRSASPAASSLAEAAVRRSTVPALDERAADLAEQWAWLLSPLALVPGAHRDGRLHRRDRRPASPGWSAARRWRDRWRVVLDRGRVTGDLPLGTLARVGSVAVLAGAAELPAARDRDRAPRRGAASRSPTPCGSATRRSPSVPRSPSRSPSAPSPAPPVCPSPPPAWR